MVVEAMAFQSVTTLPAFVRNGTVNNIKLTLNLCIGFVLLLRPARLGSLDEVKSRPPGRRRQCKRVLFRPKCSSTRKSMNAKHFCGRLFLVESATLAALGAPSAPCAGLGPDRPLWRLRIGPPRRRLAPRRNPHARPAPSAPPP